MAPSSTRTPAQLRDFIQLVCCIRTNTDAALRAGLASSMRVGVVSGRRIIAVPTLAAADTEELVVVLGPAIQQILVL